MGSLKLVHKLSVGHVQRHAVHSAARHHPFQELARDLWQHGVRQDRVDHAPARLDLLAAVHNGLHHRVGIGERHAALGLDALAKWYDAKIDQQKIAADQSTGAAEKAVKMVQKSVVSTLANAVAGLKKVKADPTPATFNEIFNQSDNPARKLQVQLVAAANGQKKGLLPTRGIRVDPRTVADMLTPWQAGGKGQAIATDDMDKAAILKRLGELADIVKLAKAFVDDLVNAAG